MQFNMKSISLKIARRWRTNHFSAMTCFGVVDHNRLDSHPQTHIQHRDTISHTHTPKQLDWYFLVSALIYCGLTTHTATKKPPQHMRFINLLFNSETTFGLRCLTHGKITNRPRKNSEAFLSKGRFTESVPLRLHAIQVSVVLCFAECRRKLTGYMHFHWHTVRRESRVEVNQTRAVMEIRGRVWSRKDQLWI